MVFLSLALKLWIKDDKMSLGEIAKSNIVFGIAGILLGASAMSVSNAIGSPIYNLVILIVVIFALKIFLERFAGIKQPKGWWFSNGVMLCIFLWIVIWTILFNMTP